MITLQELQQIVRQASKLMLVDTFEISEKGDIANIVTSSDVAVQDFLCRRLAEALPGSGFLCEEEDAHDLSHEYTWIIDPIDGTANYSRGIDQCAISVALKKQPPCPPLGGDLTATEGCSPSLEGSYATASEGCSSSLEGSYATASEGCSPSLEGSYATASEGCSPSLDRTVSPQRGAGGLEQGLLLAVVYLPRTNEMFCAERGKGATRNGKPIHVSDRPFRNSIMCTALAVYHKEYADVCSRIIVETFKQCNDIRRFGAAAPELCYLAMGRCELYFEYLLSPWDFAAASLILQEAGGVLCDLQGNPLTCLEPKGVLAANNQENLDRLLAIVQSEID